jgi:hypothetical protein
MPHKKKEQALVGWVSVFDRAGAGTMPAFGSFETFQRLFSKQQPALIGEFFHSDYQF